MLEQHSSRFYCDGHVEFLWSQMRWSECESLHTRLIPFAPSPSHRLVHVDRDERGFVTGIFCAKPSDCVLKETEPKGATLTERFALELDYNWN